MDHRLPKHDVVLLGIGHTNAHVVRMWRMAPIPDARLTCISNFGVATYSGMLPGTLAGFYEPWQMQIDLVRLCASVGARLIVGEEVRRLDLERREIVFANRPPVHFDVLSIGVGSVPRPLEVVAGGRSSDETDDSGTVASAARSACGAPASGTSLVVPIKPMQTFLDRLDERLRTITPRLGQRSLRVAIVGAGAAGVEIAFCLPRHLRLVLGDMPYELTLIDRRQEVAHGLEPRAAELVRREIVRRGIRTRLGCEVQVVEQEGLLLNGDERVAVDLVLLGTSATAPSLLRRLGLPTDDEGFLLVQPTLKTVADDVPVFVVGDSGVDATHPHPKAGVYAVRQGPVLWENIGRMLRDEPLKEYLPQRRFLKLLCTGDGRAILSYDGCAAHRAWCWRLKDWIDRRFMAKYQHYEPMSVTERPTTDITEAGEPAQMRCAGCGGKMGGAVLRRVLQRLDVSSNDQVIVGIDSPDDAAAVRLTRGDTVVATADFFSAFLDDPYLVGRVAALNAASDLFASGTTPVAAIALATIPVGSAEQQERLLYELLAGGMREFRAMGVALVGGHTIEGPQLTIGYSLLGEAEDTPRWKAGLRPGDWLVLTKPLGTGVLLAAHMQARCRAAWFTPLSRTLLQSNQPPPGFFDEYEILGVTDVTGFGLAGHLLEMLTASGASAEIWLDRIPALPGALDLLGEGIESTLAPANREIAEGIVAASAVQKNLAYPLLFDPQTSGGLLFGVPQRYVSAAMHRWREHCGVDPELIGRVMEASPDGPHLRVAEASPPNVLKLLNEA